MEPTVFESQNPSPSKLFTQSQDMFSNIKSQVNDSFGEDGLFFERPKEEVEGGMEDSRGFYVTPNGSFWDEEGNYFNSQGKDKYGGTYDKYGVYIPGNAADEDKDLFVIKEEDYKNISKIKMNELKQGNLNDKELNIEFGDFEGDKKDLDLNDEDFEKIGPYLNQVEIDKDIEEFLREGMEMEQHENNNNIHVINQNAI